MCVYSVSSKVTLKCAGSLFGEARVSRAVQREESFKICGHPLPLTSAQLPFLYPTFKGK